MARVLWVTDEVPDPGLGGGSIRQHALLSRVAARHPVDLLLVGHLRDAALREQLASVKELAPPAEPSPFERRWRSRQGVLPGMLPSELAMTAPLRQLLKPHLAAERDHDVVVVEHEWLAPLLPAERKARWVITLQNLLSRRMEQQAARLSGLRRRRVLAEAARARRFEESLARRWDRTVVVSPADAAALQPSAGDRVAVVPNGVDLDKFAPSPLPPEPVLMFCGLFAWPANVEAATWFCREVFPLVRRELPQARLLLVGRSPAPEVRSLTAMTGVEGHFDVESIVPYYRRARVALAPLHVGSGTRIKALEAMAAGRPLAGTPIGLEGLGLEDGVSAAVAADGPTLAEKIVGLCRDGERARRMAGAARQLAVARFGWDALAVRFEEAAGLDHGRGGRS